MVTDATRSTPAVPGSVLSEKEIAAREEESRKAQALAKRQTDEQKEKQQRETARKNVLASIGGVPTGRLSTPDEVAALVLLLASPVTANVTGSNYVIDGGLIKTT